MEREELQKIADRKWAEMIRALDEKGADFAFDIFMEALVEASNL